MAREAGASRAGSTIVASYRLHPLSLRRPLSLPCHRRHVRLRPPRRLAVWLRLPTERQLLARCQLCCRARWVRPGRRFRLLSTVNGFLRLAWWTLSAFQRRSWCACHYLRLSCCACGYRRQRQFGHHDAGRRSAVRRAHSSRNSSRRRRPNQGRAGTHSRTGTSRGRASH